MIRALGVAIVASVLLFANQNSASIESINKSSITDAKKEIDDTKSSFVKEAIESLKIATKAYKELSQNRADDAKKSIQEALDRLEKIISSEDAPKYLLIDRVLVAKDFVGDLKVIEDRLKLIKEAINSGKIQEARELIVPMQSQLEVTSVSLPLATYPDALNLASKYISQENIDEAKRVLHMALNTLYEERVIIPMPLIRAQEFVYRASKLPKEKKDQINLYLDEATKQLKIARALGYVSSSSNSYKSMLDEISKIKEGIDSNKNQSGLFEKLIANIKDFKEKIVQNKGGEDAK